MPQFVCDSRTGRRHEENQDRVIARELSSDGESFLIAVADGISSCAFGGSVARWLIDQHLAKDGVSLQGDGDPDVLIWKYLQGLHTLFCDESSDIPEMLESGACLSLAVHLDGQTHAFWVGDSPIYQTSVEDNRYRTKLVSQPDSLGANGVTDWFGGTSPFELKHVQLSAQASIVTITSDGAIHNAEMLNDAYQQYGFSDLVAEEVCQEALKNPHADDVSIVAMNVDV